MPIRNASQRIGRTGERAVESLIDDHPRWVARRQDSDFGIDLEAELADPGPDGQVLRGQLIKLQIKAGATPAHSGAHVAVALERTWLDYACQFRVPVILVATTADGQQAWWVWAQAWALVNERRLADARGKTITLRAPIVQTLAAGLDHDLADIAAGRHPVAMVLALRGVLAVAHGWENATIAQGIVELLGRTDYPSRDWTIRMIVDQMTAAGSSIMHWQAQHYLSVMLALVRTAGDALAAEDIVHLVKRGVSHSRVGIQALGPLYDAWPDHALALGLPQAFAKAQLAPAAPAAWYAAMRERFPGQHPFGMFIASQPEDDLTHDGVTLRLDPGVRDYLRAKWPNRGGSAMLDCLAAASA